MAELDRKTILIVDNHPVTRYGIKAFLEDHWHQYIQVLEANTAREALGLIRKGGIHLLVVDLEIDTPDDGEQLVKTLHQEGYAFPCVMICESIMPPDYAESFAKKNNLQGFFNKAVPMDVLISHIAGLLNLPKN